MSYATDRLKDNNPVMWYAYREAKDLIDAGNGFTFRVRTNSGDTFEGIPPSSEAIEAPADGILRLEMGSDLVVIPQRAIETITVVAVA